MKLKRNNTEKLSNNRMRVRAEWSDQMRREGEVKLTINKNVEPMDNVLVEADERDVTNTLFGLAEIAWRLGWRPRGLPGTLANLVQQYKLPPEE